MGNTNLKLTTSAYLGIIFFLLLFVAIFMKDLIFENIVLFTGGSELAESQQANKELSDLLLSLDSIALDTRVLNSEYFENLSPFPSFPIDAQSVSNFGKMNPFIGSFVVVPNSATSSVGGLIYSNQRGANNGQSQTTVPSTRR